MQRVRTNVSPLEVLNIPMFRGCWPAISERTSSASRTCSCLIANFFFVGTTRSALSSWASKSFTERFLETRPSFWGYLAAVELLHGDSVSAFSCLIGWRAFGTLFLCGDSSFSCLMVERSGFESPFSCLTLERCSFVACSAISRQLESSAVTRGPMSTSDFLLFNFMAHPVSCRHLMVISKRSSFLSACPIFFWNQD